jgi:hypothetical protein
MGPEVALAAAAGGQILGGMAAKESARGEKRQSEINSFIGRTRAIQTGTSAAQTLENDLGSFRAALGANGQAPNVGTMEVMNDLREARNRESRITVGNRNTEAADYRMRGRNAGYRGDAAMLSGIIKAGPSLFDIYDYRRASSGTA